MQSLSDVIFCITFFSFGSDARNTLISNESIPKMGPGPAAYNQLHSLKKVVVSRPNDGPVMRQPHKVDERVRQKLNVSSSQDLIDKRLLLPGPGASDPDNSQISNRGAPF